MKSDGKFPRGKVNKIILFCKRVNGKVFDFLIKNLGRRLNLRIVKISWIYFEYESILQRSEY